MDFEIAQNILFTGAGFTKNFGGLLAKEMWAKIFNNTGVQAYSRVRELLLEDYDYESIYHKIITGDYSDDEKRSIEEAVFEAYQILDEIARKWTFGSDAPNPVNIYGVNKFIERFSWSREEACLFFTLNQDLFIERHFNSSATILSHPGMSKIPDAHVRISRLPMEKKNFITTPTYEELTTNNTNPISKNSIHYVKLHGSFGWLSSDGANNYVIGKEKVDQIENEPLLSWYFELFKKALANRNRKLLVIGYGFMDTHINDEIAKSVKDYGLKLYIVSPSDQSTFIDNLKNKENGDTILKGFVGYYPYTLLDIFPADDSESHAWREIEKSYFAN